MRVIDFHTHVQPDAAGGIAFQQRFGTARPRRTGTPGELLPLTALGVEALGLTYSAVSRDCDARGNCAVERSRVEISGGKSAELVDVHLACQ